MLLVEQRSACEVLPSGEDLMAGQYPLLLRGERLFCRGAGCWQMIGYHAAAPAWSRGTMHSFLRVA